MLNLPEPKGKVAVAVYGFRDQTGQYKPSPDSSFSTAVTQGASSILVRALKLSGWFTPVERENLQNLLTERKIVRAIPGTTSSSPEVLKTRMNLLKARSQFDIDVADSFRQWQENNPGRSYYEFERKSGLYKDIKKNFEAETERLFGGIKAVPTRQRKEEARGGKDLTSAKQRVDDLLKD